jgi:hypothetical protein
MQFIMSTASQNVTQTKHTRIVFDRASEDTVIVSGDKKFVWAGTHRSSSASQN